MELYVKMTDEELEEFKKNKNNPNVVDLKKLTVDQLLNLKLKKVAESGIIVNPKTGFRERKTVYADEHETVEVVLTAKEVY